MKKYIKHNTNVTAGKNSSLDLLRYFDDLDEKFTFDLDDEFEIYAGADRIPCYVVDTHVFGDGSGLSYTIAIPVGDKDHWQMNEWIEKGINEYFSEQTDGSDYTFGINGDVEKNNSVATMLPTDVDGYNTYLAEVEVIPYQNVGPYGDYGIDAGLI